MNDPGEYAPIKIDAKSNELVFLQNRFDYSEVRLYFTLVTSVSRRLPDIVFFRNCIEAGIGSYDFF